MNIEETKREIKKIMESLSDFEKSKLLAGIQPKPLSNLTPRNLFEINEWRINVKDLEEFRKSRKGRKLRILFQELETKRCFADFIKIDQELFSRIRRWRDKLVRVDKNTKEVDVLLNKEIERICRVVPKTKERLLGCLNVYRKISNNRRISLYGKKILEIIKEYHRA